MNFLLHKYKMSSIYLEPKNFSSELLKQKYKKNNLNKDQLYNYLTILIHFIIYNSKIDVNLCLYSRQGDGLITIDKIIETLEDTQMDNTIYNPTWSNNEYYGNYEDIKDINIDMDQFNILTKIQDSLLKSDKNIFYMYVLPSNIIQVEIINEDSYILNDLQKTHHNQLKEEYLLVKYNQDQDNWLKMGYVCETCDISTYYDDYINKLNESTYDTIYDPIYETLDICLLDKYKGRYLIDSINGLTYRELAKAIKMILMSKFLRQEEIYQIKNIKLEKSHSNKFKLVIILNITDI